MFSVDTEAEAQAAIARYCIRRYDGSNRWTHWPQDLDPQTEANEGFPHMDAVTEELRQWWIDRHKPEHTHFTTGRLPIIAGCPRCELDLQERIAK